MGLFRRKSDDAEQIEELKEQVRVLRERLDAADAQKAELIARVDASDAAKARLEARADETDVSKARLEARVGSIDAMSKQLDSQAGDVDTLSTEVRRIAEQLASTPAPPAPPSVEAGPPPAAPPETTAAPPSPPPTGPAAAAVTDERVHEIEQRLADLDEVDDRLDALAAAVARQADEALSAGGEGIDPERVNDMANRLEDLSVAVATHGNQLAATRERVDALEHAEAADDDGVDEKTMEAVDDMRRQIGQMAERVTTLDRRLTNVSTELANQLTELSRDIDAVTDRSMAGTLPPPMASAGADDLVTDELATEEMELRLAEKFDMAIDEVRESQERLAAEQARYEIKFREDLADLAERLRRPRTPT